jgi:hypothetical protein
MVKIAGIPRRTGTALLAGLLLAAAQAATGVAAAAGTGGPARRVPPAAALAWHLGPGLRPALGWLTHHPGPRTPPPLPGSRLVPQPGRGSLLDGVFCVSPANCWAVGFYVPSTQEIELNEALHWNGSAWSAVSVPNPAGTADGDFNNLIAVRCTASNNCWAVGDSSNSGGALNQALHWNGRKWSLVRTPQPAGTAVHNSNALFDVVCRTAGNCWAVGTYQKGTTKFNQALHWNGRKWSVVRTPQPGGTGADDGNALNAVRCVSPSTCLAVGSVGMITSPFSARNEVLRWNGRTWSPVPVPSPGGNPGAGGFSELNGLTCVSVTSCWAVGDYGTFIKPTFFSQAVRWNGRRWSLLAVPEPGGTASGAEQGLSSASCSSPANCWAVGDYVPSGGDTLATLNLAVHWNGTAWSQVTTPDPGGFDAGDLNDLAAVRCTSAANCWAVGLAGSPGAIAAEALHWDGGIWSAG